MERDSRNRSPHALQRARTLRSNLSTSEQIVWNLLRRRRTGFLFKRQVPIGPYIMDFYCAEASLCVEVDGEHHLDEANRDRSRDQFLLNRGVQTFRIPTAGMFDNQAEGVLFYMGQVVELCYGRSGRSPAGR